MPFSLLKCKPSHPSFMRNQPPIASPDGQVSTFPQPNGEMDFRALAGAQKWVLWAMLAGIASLFLGMNNQPLLVDIASGPVPNQRAVLVIFIRLAIALLTAVAMYRLGRALKIKWPWLAAFLSFVPILGLVVLLGLNGQASAKLRAAGYKVGLMGARKKLSMPQSL